MSALKEARRSVERPKCSRNPTLPSQKPQSSGHTILIRELWRLPIPFFLCLPALHAVKHAPYLHFIAFMRRSEIFMKGVKEKGVKG
jgi:hypothetical protein